MTGSTSTARASIRDRSARHCYHEWLVFVLFPAWEKPVGNKMADLPGWCVLLGTFRVIDGSEGQKVLCFSLRGDLLGTCGINRGHVEHQTPEIKPSSSCTTLLKRHPWIPATR